MTTSPLMRCLLPSVALLAFPLVGMAPASGPFFLRPNVILIVTDDQGYGDLSCHGNPWLHTPNLDRLYAESVRLEDYHVEPVCTPTRASLMTGRYASRVGAWTVTQGWQLLKPSEVTMADVFSDSGYRTGMFGKWHLGDPWPYAPRFRGFQEVVRHLAGGIDEIGNPIGNDFFDDTYCRNGLPQKIDGYCTDVFFAECQRFIAEKSGKPFFAYSIRLSRFPDDAPEAMRATRAVLRIGEHKLEKDLHGSESDVIFSLDLQKGHALLQSCLSDEHDNVRGAYFAEVTFLHPSLSDDMRRTAISTTSTVRLACLVSHSDAGGMGTGTGRVGALRIPKSHGQSAPAPDRSFKEETQGEEMSKEST